MRKLLDEGDISDRQVKTFYNAVRQFYERAAEYAISNLPLHNETLKSAQFLNFDSRETAMFSHVEHFVRRYVLLFI